jgi:hypothetical protein
MGLFEKFFNYNEIVPEPTFAQKHLPTFLEVVQKWGYFKKPEEKVDVGKYVKIRMPQVPYDNGGHNHPLLYFFESVQKLADKVNFSDDEQKNFTFMYDESSCRRIINVDFQGDGTFMGNAMDHTIALSSIAYEWFEQQEKYRIRSFGAGGRLDTLELKLEKRV